MLRRIPRLLRRAVIVMVLLAVSASVYQSWAAGSPGTGGWVQTEFGPLGPADRDLLVKVRLAGLWEGPTGQQAEQQASSAEVKDVGRKISTEHAQLDEITRNTANQLGVLLPSSPTSQQVAWMNEISAQTGSDYDRVFVQRLREAHGNVLPIISQVRASTRNDLVRQFATTAAEFVTRHHQYLEGTGLVDYSALPQPSPGLFGGGTNPQDLIVPVLVFAAALLAAIALFWGLRQRGAGRRERVTIPDRGPLSGLAAMAAIPAPRRTPDLAMDETGPIPTITDSGPLSSVTDTGSHRWPSGAPRRRASETGSFEAVSSTRSSVATETGPQRVVTDTGPQPTVSASDTGSQRAVSDTGSQRAVSDTGSQRAVTDSGSHRPVSDSGAHRLPRSRPRHSMRR
jgi:predicted outer membrane protein